MKKVSSPALSSPGTGGHALQFSFDPHETRNIPVYQLFQAYLEIAGF
ncbi:MAG: hypothetical protein MK106_13940 [Mariniblastus sp.]|nr:hypothetical protein [Mariniblastus sp.]